MHGSILHDASYYSIVELKGPEMLLKAMLNQACDPQRPGPGSQRCVIFQLTLFIAYSKLDT